MWQVWSRSGDPTIDRLFATGLEQMNARQGEQAVETFSEIIRRQPEFAEGWNKRATVYYLLGEYQKSLADCDEVMKRNPVSLRRAQRLRDDLHAARPAGDRARVLRAARSA